MVASVKGSPVTTPVAPSQPHDGSSPVTSPVSQPTSRPSSAALSPLSSALSGRPRALSEPPPRSPSPSPAPTTPPGRRASINLPTGRSPAPGVARPPADTRAPIARRASESAAMAPMRLQGAQARRHSEGEASAPRPRLSQPPLGLTAVQRQLAMRIQQSVEQQTGAPSIEDAAPPEHLQHLAGTAALTEAAPASTTSRPASPEQDEIDSAAEMEKVAQVFEFLASLAPPVASGSDGIGGTGGGTGSEPRGRTAQPVAPLAPSTLTGTPEPRRASSAPPAFERRTSSVASETPPVTPTMTPAMPISTGAPLRTSSPPPRAPARAPLPDSDVGHGVSETAEFLAALGTPPSPPRSRPASLPDSDAGHGVSETAEFLATLGTPAPPAPASTSTTNATTNATTNEAATPPRIEPEQQGDIEMDIVDANPHGTRPSAGASGTATATPTPPQGQTTTTTTTTAAPQPQPGANGAGAANTPDQAVTTLAADLQNWVGNLAHVVGHEALAVGVTTAIREVVDGLIRHLQNLHPESAKAQEAAAGALIALIGLGNLMSMLMRRNRGTNTATADAGNVLQIAGLISSAIGAGKTQQLKDLLPQLTRTVVYAGGRDGINAVMPYQISTQGANSLAAQGWNTVPYSINQFLVNWAQGTGMSGAGYANALHEISQMSNQTEADAARKKLDAEAPGQLTTYVTANLAGEIADKLLGSLIEQAIGEGGMGGIGQMTIRHDAPHLPNAGEWGDAIEKTISRMSLFGQALGSTAAIGTAITPARYGDYGAAMGNNAVGGALVGVLCLPFVMTLMKKTLATVNGGNPA
ncbi:hypothetical protein [Burkholderia plantarii]|uniref:hypothetical protein n=1 Tax=Burkholderia plantarii TaxID=41899 RepID=UPI0018DC0C73|nr:hypothetical protein [Burkholderia plantarii]MBI0327111.1 hypothetical protein [Burkholderia plantarii]